jgi:hypothetical protein
MGSNSRIILPRYFLKYFEKPNSWLRSLVRPKTYEFFRALCHNMTCVNSYRPAISLRETYKYLLDDKSDQMARKAEGELKKYGAIRLSQKDPEVWEISPQFAVKTKFLSGNILEGWCKEIPYTRDFEVYWSKVTQDKHRNFRYAPLDENPEESEGEDYMLLKQEVQKSREEIYMSRQEIKTLSEKLNLLMKMIEAIATGHQVSPEEARRHLTLVKK